MGPNYSRSHSGNESKLLTITITVSAHSLNRVFKQERRIYSQTEEEKKKKTSGRSRLRQVDTFTAQFIHAVTVGAALLRPASTRMLYVVPQHHEEHLDAGLFTLTLPVSTIHRAPHLFYSLDQFTPTSFPHFNTMLSCSIVMEIVRADLQPRAPRHCLSWRRKPCPLLHFKYTYVIKG